MDLKFLERILALITSDQITDLLARSFNSPRGLCAVPQTISRLFLQPDSVYTKYKS